MGNDKSIWCSNERLSRSDFEFVKVIGRGAFGKVWKVIFRKNNKEYSMKEMLKLKIIDTNNEQNVIQEREIQSKINHPLISNLIFSFQDYKYLYLILDYLQGGDLRYHIKKGKKFNENEISKLILYYKYSYIIFLYKLEFVLACIISSLSYLHSNNIIHRDVKPENLVFDSEGYLRLTDFGIARILQENSCFDISGTPSYMAPEVLSGLRYTYVADYYSLGIIGYELINGKRPIQFNKRERNKYELFNSHLPIKIGKNNKYSNELIDFLNSLLCDEPRKRLGYKGEDEIKRHPLFKGFKWDKLEKKELYSPFYGIKKNPNDLFEKEHLEKEDFINNEVKLRYERYMDRNEYVNCFFGYTFINQNLINKVYKPEIKLFRNASCKNKILLKHFSEFRKIYKIKNGDIKCSIKKLPLIARNVPEKKINCNFSSGGTLSKSNSTILPKLEKN